MSSNSSVVTVTDQFCGAGGSSTGATRAGAEVKLAMNHWKRAIETHNSNFPQTTHVCTDIQATDPRRYARTTILITSPECTNHSLAKGRKRLGQGQLSFDEKPLPVEAEERSRATMWDVCRFAEQHRYEIIIVENVVDARHWQMWDSWMHAMTVSLKYECKIVYFNSMFAFPTPQSRDRMYCVFWRKGNKAPDLDFMPEAFCPRCECNVFAVQSWKNPMKTYGKYRQQYLYLCPSCATTVQPYYYCAATAIDWSLPIQRVGDRKQPLKPKTIARIEAGLKKYTGDSVLMGMGASQYGSNYSLQQPFPTQTTSETFGLSVPPPQPSSAGLSQLSSFLVETAHSHSGENRTCSITKPIPTQSSQLSQSLVIPPLSSVAADSGVTRPVTEPYFTQTTAQTVGVVVTPWLMGNYTPGTHRTLDKPVGTITTQDHNSLVVPPAFLTSYYGDEASNHSLSEPVGTVTTLDRHALVTSPAPNPFILSYYTRDRADQNSSSISDALGTMAAQPRHYIVQPDETSVKIKVEECGFRMLQPKEIGRAMAFPDEYIVIGNSREKVRQYGNAVTPPVMEMIMRRCLATLSGAY